MEYRKLSNGVSMPVMGFGTYQITDLAQCQQCVLDVIAAGYRMIDIQRGGRGFELRHSDQG